MSWCHSSFSLQKKINNNNNLYSCSKKNVGNVSLTWSLPFPLFSELITSHMKRVLHRLSTHPCCNRISVKVPWPIFTSVSGASPIQPPLEPDYPCLKTFPADLVTYNLNMKCCAHKLWGAMEKLVKDFYLAVPVYLLPLMHNGYFNPI